MPNRLFQTPERSQWLAVAFPISKMIPLHMNNTFKDTSAFDNSVLFTSSVQSLRLF